MGGGDRDLKGRDLRKTGDLRKQCVWTFPQVTTMVQRRGWYSADWVLHPAKMPVLLARAIIQTYTSPGDLILDPMAGFFTTGIEAGRLGRFCIGIELKGQYVDAIGRSIEIASNHLSLFETFTPPIIIRGDAKELPLKSADKETISAVVMSPPHGDIATPTAYPSRIHKLALTDMEKAVEEAEQFEREYVKKGGKWGIRSRENIRLELLRSGITNYSDDPRNIGNHKYVSAVLMSPPYGDDPTGAAWTENKDDPNWRCGHRQPAKRYSDDERNIGNHRYVSAVLMSPVYGNRLSDPRVADGDPQRMSYRQSLKSPAEEALCRQKGIPPVTYSTDKKNIGTEKGPTYLSSMLTVYRECFRVLRPGALLILVLKNFVRGKKIVRLDLDTRKLCEAVGFTMLPCPEGCADKGHTHLRSIVRHSFWLNDLIKKWKDQYGEIPCPYAEASRYEQIQVYQKAV